METKKIDIDTECNFLIERRRKSFAETPNDIIKRCLKEETTMDPVRIPSSRAYKQARRLPRSERYSGEHRFELNGRSYTEPSLRAAYIACLRALQASDSGFFSKLAQEETRARRIIADRPNKLYKASPELAELYAEKIDANWYVDVNLSTPQVIQRLKIACRVADITYGSDLKVHFA